MKLVGALHPPLSRLIAIPPPPSLHSPLHPGNTGQSIPRDQPGDLLRLSSTFRNLKHLSAPSPLTGHFLLRRQGLKEKSGSCLGLEQVTHQAESLDAPPFTVPSTRAIAVAIRFSRTGQRSHLPSILKERSLHHHYHRTCNTLSFGPSWSRSISQLAVPHEQQVDDDMNNDTIAAKTTPSPSPGPGLVAGASPTQTTSGTKRKRTAAVKYYAVKEGFRPGIYYNWNDCLAQVTGFKGAVCEFSYCLPTMQGS